MDREELRAKVLEELRALSDPKYRDFISGLIPTKDKARILGVRSPALRSYAKAFPKELAEDYLALLPHRYLEEDNLHTALIGRMKGYDEALAHTRAFLPNIDNWATCDSFKAPALIRQPERFIPELRRCLASGHAYTIRYGIVNLMAAYLGRRFDGDMIAWVCAVDQEDYYVRMAVAWYMAEALIKQPASALPVLRERRLSPFTHNKAIQKAVESRRISPEDKEDLKRMRIR